MMDELRAPDCKVFVDADVSETELISLTSSGAVYGGR